MLLEPGRVHDLVQQARAHDTAIICHSTIDLPEQAVCRGFADAYDTTPLQVARRLGKLVEVPPSSPYPTSLQARPDLTSPPCGSGPHLGSQGPHEQAWPHSTQGEPGDADETGRP